MDRRTRFVVWLWSTPDWLIPIPAVKVLLKATCRLLGHRAKPAGRPPLDFCRDCETYTDQAEFQRVMGPYLRKPDTPR